MSAIKKTYKNNKVTSILLFALAIILMTSLISYDSTDPSFNLVSHHKPKNLLAYFGSHLSDILYQILGLASFVIPICLIIWSYLIFYYNKINWKIFKFPALILSAISFATILNNFPFSETLPARGGGIVGIYLWQYTINMTTKIHITELHTKILFALLGVMFLIIAFGIKLSNYYITCSKILYGAFVICGGKIITPYICKLLSSNYNTTHAFYPSDEFGKIRNNQNKIIEDNNEEPSFLINKIVHKPDKDQIININKDNIIINKIKDEVRSIPSIDLLENSITQKIKIKPLTQSELNENAEELLAVLEDFAVKGNIVNVRQGPVVTLYEFEPAAGTKSSKVIGLSDDIARSLSAISTRIAVIPGRNALGIELPNKNRMFFSLKELIQTSEFQSTKHALPLILGKDLGGNPMIVDLAKMPHLLVAGTTGSGKSVAINAMIMSLLYKYTPSECRMIMIDPKMLELSAYDNIPHLMTPVVTEPAKAVVALKWAVKEMEERYRLMSYLGVRNVANYNEKILDTIQNNRTLERKIQTGFDPETGNPIYDSVAIEPKKMPFIVVIVDEMADLMLVAGKDIESSIQRLAQMARAAGIHLIMATQRPSVDVITGVIKANFPSRISFKVTSKIDSRTILGEQGSEQLLGMGDMLYMGNGSKILRVHGPFVDDKEVMKVADYLRSTAIPEYISAVTEDVESDSLYSNGIDTGDDNSLYNQAVNIVKRERKSSISYIQRSLRIGYNKAANLVEEMERNGILSSPNHSGKREILLPDD